MKLIALIAALALAGCSQFHYYEFANCSAFDVRTSRMPWNPVHRMVICHDHTGTHYFPETGSGAGLSDMLAAPVGTMFGRLQPPVSPTTP